jgi:hypothetical protein
MSLALSRACGIDYLHAQGRVVGTVAPGSEIEVSEHLGLDWVRICAPADLAGSCVRLRSRQSPRAWAGPTRA